jgi:hypothetical protein
MSPTDEITARQEAWAESRNIRCVGPGPATVADNLLLPMHPATRAEFANGDGDELGCPIKPGKMRSLRSSSALAVNVFEFWRYRPLSALTGALGLEGDYVELHFEQKLPTGLRGKRPNIDVILFQKSGPPAGIECKFCEPYDASQPHEPLDFVYLPPERGLWAKHGLTSAEALAHALGRSFRPVHLAAGQLLKHILGLANTFGVVRPIQLVYLWFDDNSGVARRHQYEIEEFAKGLDVDIVFRSLTYQVLFRRLQSAPSASTDYLTALQLRYFAT